MSQVEKITDELRALAAGVEAAHNLAATADNRAQEAAVRATAAGFIAVAAGMAQVRSTIGSIQSGLSGLGKTFGQAATACAAVPRQASSEETISVLGSVQGELATARDTVTATAGQVGEAQRLVAMVLRGGDPGPLLSALGGIREVLGQLGQRVATAGEQVTAAIAEARRLGAAGN
ncbi:DUF6244 family protein [Polymorphospora rubra]|nr:DUF6244 family protein [Polymorphospora rubra]